MLSPRGAQEKEPTEYNGWEQYVAELIERGDVSWVPRNKAIVLRDYDLQVEVVSSKQ